MLPVIGRALTAMGPERLIALLAVMESLRARGDPIVFRRLGSRRVHRTNIDLFIQVLFFFHRSSVDEDNFSAASL